jgi:hypothetical protein
VIDGSLLGGVHLLPLFTLEEHGFDLLVEEFPGFGIPGIQTVVVDEQGLVLEPLAPTILANPLVDSLPDLVSEGSFV